MNEHDKQIVEDFADFAFTFFGDIGDKDAALKKYYELKEKEKEQ